MTLTELLVNREPQEVGQRAVTLAIDYINSCLPNPIDMRRVVEKAKKDMEHDR